MIAFTIPGQPVPKGRPRLRKNGAVYTPGKTKGYEKTAAQYARLAMGSQEPLGGPVDLYVTAYFRIPSRASKAQRQAMLDGLIRPGRIDADNLGKSVMDAMNKIVYRDDAQVAEFHVSKLYALEPRVEVSVMPLEQRRAA